MIEKTTLRGLIARAITLAFFLISFTTAVFADPLAVDDRSQPTPSSQLRGETSTNSQNAPFSLNASKSEESNHIPRLPFALNARRFDQSVPEADPQFSLGAPKFDVSAFQQAPLAGGVQKLRLLANYDIELIVDESLSMRRRDCPGGLSRWNWCGMQAGQLATQLAPFVRSGFTLTTFGGGYDVYNNATPDNLSDLFQNPAFTLGTRMAEPLADRLNNYFFRHASNGKPLLIAIITDGVPTPKREPFMVADVLINATRKMRDPREVTVVFFQIGASDYRGQSFLNYLDHGLLADGARFDIVRNVSMERLEQIGLAQSLIDSIHDFAANSKIGPESEIQRGDFARR